MILAPLIATRKKDFRYSISEASDINDPGNSPIVTNDHSVVTDRLSVQDIDNVPGNQA